MRQINLVARVLRMLQIRSLTHGFCKFHESDDDSTDSIPNQTRTFTQLSESWTVVRDCIKDIRQMLDTHTNPKGVTV